MQPEPDAPRPSDGGRPHFLDPLDPRKPFTLREAASALRRLEREVTGAPLAADDGAPTRRLLGLDGLVRRMIQAVVLHEHVLIEGPPGLAKTAAAKALANALGLAYRRIQFVPDLLPSEIVQRERLDLDEAGRATINWAPGPVFTNILLADEINRASPKAQSALLEVSEERQVSSLYRPRTIVRPRDPDEAAWLREHGPFFGESERFDPEGVRGQVFVALATMNPIEQEGVYPLSEAQLDRFALHVVLDQPERRHFDAISCHAFEASRARFVGALEASKHVKTLYFLDRLRGLLLGGEALRRWLSGRNAALRDRVGDLIELTHISGPGERLESRPRTASPPLVERLVRWRKGEAGPDLARYAANVLEGIDAAKHPEVSGGSSPRGLLKLIRCAHAEALLNGHFGADEEDVASPDWSDVRGVAADVLRHRVRLSPTSEALGQTVEAFIEELLEWVGQRP